MKVPSLRSSKYTNRQYQIRPVSNDDWPMIERLLTYAERHYMALEWWTLQEWVGSTTFLLVTDRHRRSAGLALTVVGDGPVGWLRVISVSSEEYVQPLLAASAEAVQARGGTGVAFLGNDRWILPIIRRAGFQKINHVVTLQYRGAWDVHNGPTGLQMRTATVADIGSVLVVDHAAFSPLWWYNREVLMRALSLAYTFEVAYLEGECVGYQLCTLRNGRAHIVRLAVHPRHQRQGIGGQLLGGALNALNEAQAGSVTVNTQEDNLASLRLYRRFSFDLVGRPWAVWYRSLE